MLGCMTFENPACSIANNEIASEEMEFKMRIRNETASDIESITQVTITAFRTLPISNHTEKFIIKALRAAVAQVL